MKKALRISLYCSDFQGLNCGVGEIRTREPLLATTRFPGVPLQPLEHHSLLNLSLIHI